MWFNDRVGRTVCDRQHKRFNKPKFTRIAVERETPVLAIRTTVQPHARLIYWRIIFTPNQHQLNGREFIHVTSINKRDWLSTQESSADIEINFSLCLHSCWGDLTVWKIYSRVSFQHKTPLSVLRNFYRTPPPQKIIDLPANIYLEEIRNYTEYFQHFIDLNLWACQFPSRDI